MKRLGYLDLTKGIGIFLVVLGHATFVNEKVITWVFSFHMPLFFIVSGILLAKKDFSQITMREFLYGKLETMIVPYLFFSISYSLIDILSVYFKQISMRDLKINLICTGTFSGSGPLWFLTTLFFCEILFVFLVKHLGEAKAIAASVLLSCIGFATNRFFAPVFELSKENLRRYFLLSFPFELIRCMICLIFIVVPFMLIKVISRRYPKNEAFLDDSHKITIKNRSICLISGVFLLVLTAYLAGFNSNIDIHNLDYGNVALFLLNAGLGSFGLILICRCLPSNKFFTPIIFWGKNSLTIMATHLNFYILFLGNVIAYKINPYIRHAKEYVLLFNILLITMLIETILILLLNRFLPRAVGKRKNPR